jgi:hypothetical protein
VIQITVPLAGVWLAAAIGAGIGAFIFCAMAWRFYVDTDRARHNYMAQQLSGVRRRNNDWEHVGADPFPPSRKLDRLVHYLLDKFYSRGRPPQP